MTILLVVAVSLTLFLSVRNTLRNRSVNRLLVQHANAIRTMQTSIEELADAIRRLQDLIDSLTIDTRADTDKHDRLKQELNELNQRVESFRFYLGLPMH